LHEARQYHVERFDYEQRKAYVKRVDCDYYTDAIDYTQVAVLETFESERLRDAFRVHGDVRVNRQIVGFKKIKFYTGENVGAGKLSMPEQEMHTTAFWLHFPAAFLSALPYTPPECLSGVTGLGNALRTIAALLLMCDPRDLGVAVGQGTSDVFEPNLYLYDSYPGGIGQSAPLYRMTPQLLRQTAELLAGCSCEAGCPSCVGPAGEIGDRGKEVAAAILKQLGSARDPVAREGGLEAET
jgi:DEAD/DEAH box helicase domain-containing protein